MSVNSKGKYLVRLLDSITPQHLFVLAWVAVGGIFLVLIWLNHRKTTRRNFRPLDDLGRPPVPVDTRRLPNAEPKANHLPKKIN
jgi:hypothetical protein